MRNITGLYIIHYHFLGDCLFYVIKLILKTQLLVLFSYLKSIIIMFLGGGVVLWYCFLVEITKEGSVKIGYNARGG